MKTSSVSIPPTIILVLTLSSVWSILPVQRVCVCVCGESHLWLVQI